MKDQIAASTEDIPDIEEHLKRDVYNQTLAAPPLGPDPKGKMQKAVAEGFIRQPLYQTVQKKLKSKQKAHMLTARQVFNIPPGDTKARLQKKGSMFMMPCLKPTS